jgi:UDP-sugar transporter A1/2/3
LVFIAVDSGGDAGIGGGWSFVAFAVSLLGAAGGLLVALSIKYGDSVLKTLATTGAIILSSVLDRYLLGGPLTPVMMIAGAQVILSICNYTLDSTPPSEPTKEIDNDASPEKLKDGSEDVFVDEEEIALVQKQSA